MDSKGARCINRETFLLALFQLCDTWTDEISRTAYLDFLENLNSALIIQRQPDGKLVLQEDQVFLDMFGQTVGDIPKYERPAPPFKLGSKVMVNYDGKGLWLEAVVHSANRNALGAKHAAKALASTGGLGQDQGRHWKFDVRFQDGDWETGVLEGSMGPGNWSDPGRILSTTSTRRRAEADANQRKRRQDKRNWERAEQVRMRQAQVEALGYAQLAAGVTTPGQLEAVDTEPIKLTKAAQQASGPLLEVTSKITYGAVHALDSTVESSSVGPWTTEDTGEQAVATKIAPGAVHTLDGILGKGVQIPITSGSTLAPGPRRVSIDNLLALPAEPKPRIGLAEPKHRVARLRKPLRQHTNIYGRSERFRRTPISLSPSRNRIWSCCLMRTPHGSI